jgi:hypothetical protein
MVKSFLSQCNTASGTLAGVLHLKLSPYIVMYAAMDLDVPLPDDFDKWFLWRHIEQLLQLGRTADLVDDSGELPPLLHGPTIPPEYKVNATEDPDGVLQGLYYFHYYAQILHSSTFPESKRPLSELPPIHLAISTSDRGTAGEVCSWNGGRVRHEWFGLRRQPSDPAFESSREAYAILDATCCWGLAWRGRTVRVNLSNQRLVWALNDFIDASAEFPVVEVLLALAERCGFKFMAIHAPHYPTNVDRYAQGQYNSFSEGSGLVLQLMDVVLSDVPFATGNLCDLEDVVLSTYRAILVARGARGYGSGPDRPGLLYSEMRSRQTFVTMDEDTHPTWRSQPRREPVEDLVTHSSPPDWQRTLQKRLKGGAPDAFYDISADTISTTSLCGSLVATRGEEPLSVSIFHMRRTPEEGMEEQKRRARKIVQARGSAVRLRAAEEDGDGLGVEMRFVDQWSGSKMT